MHVKLLLQLLCLHTGKIYTQLNGVLEEVERIRQHGMTRLELDNAKNIVRANIRKTI